MDNIAIDYTASGPIFDPLFLLIRKVDLKTGNNSVIRISSIVISVNTGDTEQMLNALTNAGYAAKVV